MTDPVFVFGSNLDGQRDESNLLGWAANHIESKFGGLDD